MKLKHPPKQRTNLVGQFVSYEVKDGYKVKRMNLLTGDGLQSVKLTKEARACLFRLTAETPLTPGTLLSLAVEQKHDDGAVKYKVYDLQILAAAAESTQIELPSSSSSASRSKKTKIRVCDRGTCRKRGSQKIYQQLKQAVSDRNLGDQVTLEKTGCLKECKRGPNMAIGKTCHSRLCPSAAIDLLPSQIKG
ncbi:(2Fe-2S) ferredoxin domain-containing protein [filamentous cyanobacterium LEGE 11480]|uniref:(2Fe-2S) ferredoxin domain-containing protein n=1 Tax=Romeriopsis navalis LEGE 11480 TaxID=2777977 RepID=A0A928VLS9_9CYAN|nr:(2Fe-2S) ferredoxin domain-containing protein [Romeriopsis navalis]MBE9030675.1 (2Fe-2S) ferredoxin domain-containing protein [Romeriopsis navalis LEGE 11480]